MFMPSNGIFRNTSAVLMYRDHGTGPMVQIHQQPISLSFPQSGLTFMAQGHLTFSASSSIVKPWPRPTDSQWEAELVFMPRVGILFLSDFFCYSQTDAYGTRPSMFMPTNGIFRDTSAARCVETVAQGRRSRHIKQPISISAVRT